MVREECGEWRRGGLRSRQHEAELEPQRLQQLGHSSLGRYGHGSDMRISRADPGVFVNWMSGLTARIHTFRLPGVAKGLFTPLYGETATNRRATIGAGVPLCIRDATVIFFALPGGPQRRCSPDRLPR
ncbi:hypothetical protein AA958_11390 [Streptomyces sp. CNQ-509]|nr:hypothetical protein AA958_11390 [Streptomyces sp. CNQ-509]